LIAKLKQTLKYFTSKALLFFFLLPGGFQALGQAIVTDSIPKSQMIAPTMLRIGVDLIGAAHTAINENRDAWEVQAEVDIYRYFITAEFGSEVNQFIREDYDYRSDGTYWRVGADINMIPREPFGSVLFFGLRYANGTFDEDLSGTISDPVWGDILIDSSNENVKARWIEVVAGMKAKVWKNLYMGYILRLKASLKIKNESELQLDPYRIPGYGLADQNSFFGINYYIAWQFPFRQKYAVPR